MSRPLRVLFVSHDAYRAGATIFLLNMLRWMRSHAGLQFDVALREDGEMAGEFERIGRTFLLLPPGPPAGLRARLRRGWNRWRPDRPRRSLRSLVQGGGYDVLYLNTITLGDHLAGLQGLALPVVTHVHELETVIRRQAHGQEQRVLQGSDRIVCVSDAVLANLVGNFGCPAAKARRIHGFTPVDVRPDGSPQQRRTRLLDPLGIPHDALLVGLCGHGTMVKGVDLLVPLARLLPARVAGRELHLVWIGSERPDYPQDMALGDARKAGVSGRVHFPGLTRTPADWLSLFDLHLMLSREDPFPLVVMEAAVLGVPTVAFAGAGGAAEFIGSDAGWCAPYLDLPALAAGLVELLADEPRRRALGEAARRRVLQDHAPDVVLPQVVRVIEEAAATRHADRR